MGLGTAQAQPLQQKNITLNRTMQIIVNACYIINQHFLGHRCPKGLVFTEKMRVSRTAHQGVKQEKLGLAAPASALFR